MYSTRVPNKQKSDVPTSERGGEDASAVDKDLAEPLKVLSLKEDAKETSDDSGSVADVDDEKVDSYIKHPLHNSWNFWFLSSEKNRSWEDRVTHITGFETVEDFWAVYNHIKTPSDFPMGHDYYLFKSGIK